MFTCTKKYIEISVCHRNWKAPTHCALIHGYARSVEFTIGCSELDPNLNWVFDYGDLRFVRNFLVQQWDHRLLVSDDDPLLDQFQQLEQAGALSLNVMDSSKGWGPTIEQSCRFLADHLAPMIEEKSGGRCWIEKIEIWEKEENRSSMRVGKNYGH